MDVSKNKGTPKWMVYNGKPYENGWFEGTPIFGNISIYLGSPLTAERRGLDQMLLQDTDGTLTGSGSVRFTGTVKGGSEKKTTKKNSSP